MKDVFGFIFLKSGLYLKYCITTGSIESFYGHLPFVSNGERL